MRHVIVTRVTLGLAVLFLAAAGLFTSVVRSRRAVPTAAPAEASSSETVSSEAMPSAATSSSVAPAPSVDAPAAAPGRGEVAFAARCGGCHDAASLAGRVRDDRDGALRFLRTHGEAAPEESRLILDYVATR